MVEKDVDRIKDVLVHEFSHLLTDPLCSLAGLTRCQPNAGLYDEIHERQTQRITNIICRYINNKIFTI